VHALTRVPGRIHFHDAPHLAAVLGGKIRRVNAHRLHVVSFDFRAKARGAIVHQRDSVNDELGLVLGATWVEDGVAFVEPPWLGVDEVLERAPGQGSHPILDHFRTNTVDVTCAMRIDQGIRVIYQNRGVCGGDAEFGRIVEGDLGTYFDGVLELGETGMANLDAVDSKGDALYDQIAGTIRGERLLELVGLRDQFD